MTTVYVGREKNDVKFNMEFTAEEFEAAIQSVYLKNRGKIMVPGFRKGKATRKMIENRFGAGIFYDEAIDKLLQDNYGKSLDELNLEPIDRPSVEFGEGKIEAGKGFSVVITVPVAPAPEVKDYKGIQAERTLMTLPKDAVETRLEALQKRNARMMSSEGEANWNDTVVLDFKGFIGEEAFKGGEGTDYNLVLGSGSFIPGFEAQLVGAKAGEAKDVVVTFPADYQEESLAGKEATFKCTVKEVKVEELPALDDEFAKDVSEFDTLEELKADILKKAQEEIDKSNRYIEESAVLEKLVELNPFEVPAVMVQDEANNMLNEMAQQMQMQGLNIDMYCQYTGTTIDELVKNNEPEATKRVASRILLSAVVAAEGIEATAEDLDKEYTSLASTYGMDVEEVKKAMAASENMIKKDICNRKAADLIIANAVFTEPKKEVKAEPAEAPAEEA